MKVHSKIIDQSVLWLTFLTLAGCHPNLNQFTGEYSGKLLMQTPTSLSEDDISVRVLSESKRSLTLAGHLNGQPSNRDWNWEIQTIANSSSIDLNANGEIKFLGRLNKISSECFESAESPDQSFARICVGKAESTFELKKENSSLSMIVHRLNGGEFPYLETPSNYTASELRDRASRLGFDSRFSFEQLVNTKLTLRLSQLNLLPHISAGSILNIGAYASGGAITSVGDLVPFLFPTRWIQAKENAELLRAQEQAVNIMKLDSMQIVEGFCLGIGRDNVMHTQLKADRALETEIENEIAVLEQQGKLSPGSTLSIQSAGNNLDQTISNLETLISLEMTATSQASGFVNPSAIASLTVEPLANVTAPDQLILSDLEAQTVKVSPEIHQLQLLVQAAKSEKNNRAFQWLDPSGDSTGSIGFGLPTYVEIGSSQIRKLLITKDQVNSILLRKVMDAFDDYYNSLDSYRLSVEGVRVQNARILTARKLIDISDSNAVEELRESLELLAINHTNLLTAEYGWYNAISRINRLVQKGPYSSVAETRHLLAGTKMDNLAINN